jgi:hypothetical protein
MAITTLANVKTYMGITNNAKDAVINQFIPAVQLMMERHCCRAFDSTAYTEWVWSQGGRELFLPNYPVTILNRVCNNYTTVIGIRNTAADAQMATVECDGTSLFLIVWGGASAGSATLTLATYATLTLLAAAITALGTNWESVITAGCAAYNPSELIQNGGDDALSTVYAEFVMSQDPLNVQRFNADGVVKGTFPRGKFVWCSYTAGYAVIPPDLENIAIRMISDLVNQAGHDLTLKSEKYPDYAYQLADNVLTKTLIERYKDELSLFKRVVL